MPYTLAKLKTFASRDGSGFNVTLFKDGAPIAHVHDAGCGGCVEFDFTNPAQTAASYKKFKDAAKANEEAFFAFAAGWYVSSNQREKFVEWCAKQGVSAGEDGPTTPYAAAESWVSEHVTKLELTKAFNRKSKTKTLFWLVGEDQWNGSCRELGLPYGPQAKEYLDKKYPEQVAKIWGVDQSVELRAPAGS